MDDTYDCLIVGGGAAGLSAALVLGRARRRTLLVDAGHQSNLAAHGIGGLLGHDRRPPQEFYAAAYAGLAAYPAVLVRRGEVSGARDAEGGFSVDLGHGEEVTARRLLLAGGMDYAYPTGIDGLAERWGAGVFHCPFCHGWEVSGRPLAVLGGGPIGVHQARLLTAWSDDVTLLPNGDALDDQGRAALADAGIVIDERAVVGVRGDRGEVEAVRFADGSELACGGLQVRTSLHQRSGLAADLGIAFSDANPMSSEAIRVDERNATSRSGIFAAGDLLGRPPSVSAAIASGNMAGAMIVAALTGVL